MQNYKIFYSDKVILLNGNDTHIQFPDRFVEYYIEKVTDIIRLKPRLFTNSSAKTTIITANCTTEELFEKFRTAFTTIIAAGGLAENDSGHYLLIFRRGKWDLPKGKVDNGESLEEAAIREVWEETGIRPDCIRSFLGNTYHLYSLKGEIVLKINYWYSMEMHGIPQGIPQENEGITEVKWFAKDQLNDPLKNCHSSLISLITDVL